MGVEGDEYERTRTDVLEGVRHPCRESKTPAFIGRDLDIVSLTILTIADQGRPQDRTGLRTAQVPVIAPYRTGLCDDGVHIAPSRQELRLQRLEDSPSRIGMYL